MSNQKTVKSKLVVAEKQQEQAKKADLETRIAFILNNI